MKKILLTAFFVSTFATAYSAENQQASAQAINTTCAEESKTANCGNDKVGTGLLNCLHAYSKEHKGFKISKDCEASLKQLRTDKKNGI